MDTVALEHETELISAACTIAPVAIPMTRKRLTIMCIHLFIEAAANLSWVKKKEKFRLGTTAARLANILLNTPIRLQRINRPSDRFVRTIIRRGITPAQTVPDHEDDPADNPPVIDPRHPVRQWEIRLNPAHLRLGQPDQITQGNSSSAQPLEAKLCKAQSDPSRHVNPFNRPRA